MKVIALNQIQRTNPTTGKREMIKTGTPFESSGKELEELESMGAVRKAKESDIMKAEEDGLAVINRKPRLRSRREIRALRDAEDFQTKETQGATVRPTPTRDEITGAKHNAESEARNNDLMDRKAQAEKEAGEKADAEKAALAAATDKQIEGNKSATAKAQDAATTTDKNGKPKSGKRDLGV